MKNSLIFFFLFVTTVLFAQQHPQKYIPETDPLVLEKLEEK